MDDKFSFSDFLTYFPDDNACLEEIKKQRFPNGIFCSNCNKITTHYRIRGRNSYVCKLCRKHIYPLADTIFEKSPTSLRIWFFALFLMTQTRDGMSTNHLQKNLGVTYKTAWRMRKKIRILMDQNNGDLLKDFTLTEQDKYHEHKWVFFNKLEIKVVQKQHPTDEDS